MSTGLQTKIPRGHRLVNHNGSEIRCAYRTSVRVQGKMPLGLGSSYYANALITHPLWPTRQRHARYASCKHNADGRTYLQNDYSNCCTKICTYLKQITNYRVRGFDSQFEINSGFSSKKKRKNPSKTEAEPLENRIQKTCFFRRRFFKVSASILKPLGIPSPPRCSQRLAC